MAGPGKIRKIVSPEKRYSLNLGLLKFKYINPLGFLYKLTNVQNLIGKAGGLEGLARMDVPQIQKLGILDKNKAAVVKASANLFLLGIDLKLRDFKPIARKLGVLELNSNIFQDHMRVSDLCERLGNELKLPSERVVDLKRAAMLHDIGKTTSHEIINVELNSIKIFSKYDPVTISRKIEESIIKIYSIKNRVDHAMSMRSFVENYFKGQEAEEIVESLKVLRFDPDRDPIGMFFRFHVYWSYMFLKNKIDERVLQLVAAHHFAEGANPLDPAMVSVEYKLPVSEGYDAEANLKETINKLKVDDPAFFKDMLILIAADKLEALLTRGAKTPQEAEKVFRAIITKSKYFDESDFRDILSAFKKIVEEDQLLFSTADHYVMPRLSSLSKLLYDQYITEIMQISNRFENLSKSCRAKLEAVLKKLYEMKIFSKDKKIIVEVDILKDHLLEMLEEFDLIKEKTSGSSTENIIDNMIIDILQEFHKKLASEMPEDLHYVNLLKYLKDEFSDLKAEALSEIKDSIIKRAPSALVNEIMIYTGPVTLDKIIQWNGMLKDWSKRRKAARNTEGVQESEEEIKIIDSKRMPIELQNIIQANVQKYVKGEKWHHKQEIDQYAIELAGEIKNKAQLFDFLTEIGYKISDPVYFRIPFDNAEKRESVIRVLLKWARGFMAEGKHGNHMIKDAIFPIQQLGSLAGSVRILIRKDENQNEILAIGDKNTIEQIYKKFKKYTR